MGKRSGVETAGGIMLAFYRNQRWRQAALRRELDVTDETLLRALRALIAQGMPLIRDGSDKPHVWWRVPKDWAPSGVLFPRDEIPALLRVLARSPRSRERDAVLAHATLSARAADGAQSRVEPASLSEPEEMWLTVVEKAADRAVALNMRYFSASRGQTEWRVVSAQRVLVGPPSRFVATCHRSSTLKWFRVENISQAKLDVGTVYRREDESRVLEFVNESIDGYRGDGESVECSFVVRDPEARSVRLNLLRGMRIDPEDPVTHGVRVRCSTPGVLRVARFVVGLGGAARVETPELAACVREIAKGVLDGAGADTEQDGARDPGKAKRVSLRRVEG
jgi:predicted DNA-binding transcriptional regulator YafY